MKRIARWAAAVLAAAAAAVSIVVERESASRIEDMGGLGADKVLVLYHPSRDARFSDQLSLAVVDGFLSLGYRVFRATTTGDAPDPSGYGLVAVIANTYWWTPDIPTLRYLKRARFNGRAAIGLAAGAGSTGRSRRVLQDRLEKAGALVFDVQSFWTWRPNDESRTGVPNRQVAADKARQLAVEFGQAALLGEVVPRAKRAQP